MMAPLPLPQPYSGYSLTPRYTPQPISPQTLLSLFCYDTAPFSTLPYPSLPGGADGLMQSPSQTQAQHSDVKLLKLMPGEDAGRREGVGEMGLLSSQSVCAGGEEKGHVREGAREGGFPGSRSSFHLVGRSGTLLHRNHNILPSLSHPRDLSCRPPSEQASNHSSTTKRRRAVIRQKCNAVWRAEGGELIELGDGRRGVGEDA